VKYWFPEKPRFKRNMGLSVATGMVTELHPEASIVHTGKVKPLS